MQSTSLEPFWNDQCLELSKFLWSQNLENLIFKNSQLNELFSIQTTNSPQLNQPNQSIQPIKTIIKTRKLRIYPNKKQCSKLKEWFDTTRYVYNKGVNEIKVNGNKSFIDLRNKLVTAKGNNLTEWELNVPKDVRAGALRDLDKARKTAFNNLKNGKIRKFDIKFRTKKFGYQSIEIPKTAVKSVDDFESTFNVFKTYGLGDIKICKRDSIPPIKFDLRLSHENNGRWFLLIPFESRIKSSQKNDRCSLDPGSRKFQTIYSPNEIRKITTNQVLLKKLKERISNLAKLRSGKLISPNSYSLKINRLWTRHKDLVTDCHSKLSHYLAKNYEIIYIPKFESQKLTKKMNKTSNFNILNLQHFKFKERLRNKCIEYSSKMKECTEEYTSKTCTRCGQINEVGSSEIYKCSSCKLTIDRDVNGARNIYLKCEI